MGSPLAATRTDADLVDSMGGSGEGARSILSQHPPSTMGDGRGVMSSMELSAGDEMVEGGVSDPREVVDVERVEDFLLGRLKGKAEGE